MLKDFGIFQPYVNSAATGPLKNAMFLQSEQGQDWYDLLRTLVQHDPLTGDFIKGSHARFAILDDRNQVVAVHEDASMLYPYHKRVVATNDLTVQVGMVLVGSKFQQAEPVVVIPTSITMRQARLAMLDKKLLEKTQKALAELPGEEGERARIEWEYGTHVARQGVLVAALQPALKLSDKQLDELFVHAATL